MKFGNRMEMICKVQLLFANCKLENKVEGLRLNSFIFGKSNVSVRQWD